MIEFNENLCIICHIPKDDVKSLTCGHPQCINVILECVKDEGEFSMIARQNDIDSPKKLKKYFKKMDDLKIDVEWMLEVLDVKNFKDLQEKLESMLLVLEIKDLQEAINDVQNAIEKLD